jgi:hypothetical protein
MLNLYALEPDSLAQGLDEARAFAERAAGAVNEALRFERQQVSRSMCAPPRSPAAPSTRRSAC